MNECVYCGATTNGDILVFGFEACAACLDDAKIGYLQAREVDIGAHI